ncbi:hypothetical protein [Desulfosediminicola flagellatus]|uniref:hypothetical protein n=1 Tax=Desulfosediminicola flagellatus TaxID=2569541 RepID=UPI0010ACD48F|nr:hypothetical protein [Desulfosediminicola flagellatus]
MEIIVFSPLSASAVSPAFYNFSASSTIARKALAILSDASMVSPCMFHSSTLFIHIDQVRTAILKVRQLMKMSSTIFDNRSMHFNNKHIQIIPTFRIRRRQRRWQ